MAKQQTIKAVQEVLIDPPGVEMVTESPAVVPAAVKAVVQATVEPLRVRTYHVVCPALGCQPFITECGSRAEAEAKFREVCAGLDETAVLSVTEA